MVLFEDYLNSSFIYHLPQFAVSVDWFCLFVANKKKRKSCDVLF